MLIWAGLAATAPRASADGPLEGLAKPQEGRSMRVTSTMRVGEVRRGGGERKLDPKADPRGDLEEASNWDNFRVPPGETQTVLDAKGPGRHHAHLVYVSRARTPRPGHRVGQPSGDASEDLLRRPRAAGHGSVIWRFLRQLLRQRSEVISLPVVVEDADSYNCFWHMPFRKSARIEIVNQSDNPVGLLYHNIDWIK